MKYRLDGDETFPNDREKDNMAWLVKDCPTAIRSIDECFGQDIRAWLQLMPNAFAQLFLARNEEVDYLITHGFPDEWESLIVERADEAQWAILHQINAANGQTIPAEMPRNVKLFAVKCKGENRA